MRFYTCVYLSLFFFSFLCMLLLPPRSTLFPYTTLFRSTGQEWAKVKYGLVISGGNLIPRQGIGKSAFANIVFVHKEGEGDRKSTRLNSSHVAISYAVFCLKKKKNTAARSQKNYEIRAKT